MATLSERGDCHVIVIGNEKGGTGKSTVAMHLAVALLRHGWRVGTIDLDARQGTLTSYVDYRRRTQDAAGVDLGLPDHHPLEPSGDDEEDVARLAALMGSLAATCSAVVIDTPGSASTLSRAGHAYADTLITPLNDSFVDLSVLARVDPARLKVTGPSHYAQMVWEAKISRGRRDGRSIDWIVLRNRLSHVDARNKRDMERLLDELAGRVGFRQVGGLGERVIYRELYLKGLTLLDVREPGAGVSLSMSHLAARQELRALLTAIALPLPVAELV